MSFDEYLRVAREQEDRVAELIRARGYEVERADEPRLPGRDFRPDLRVSTSEGSVYVDVKPSTLTVALDELQQHDEWNKRCAEGEPWPIAYVFADSDRSFMPRVLVASYVHVLLDDKFSEKVKLRRTRRDGRKLLATHLLRRFDNVFGPATDRTAAVRRR